MQTETTINNIAEAAKTWTPIQKTSPGRKSKFSDHIGTIRYLRSGRHMSYKDISLFFNENGVKCTYNGLMHFIKKAKIGR